jgi:hypothetical protein
LAERSGNLLARGSLIYLIAIVVCIGIAHGCKAVFIVFFLAFRRRTVNQALSHDRNKLEAVLHEFTSLSRSTSEEISNSIAACEFLIQHLPEDKVESNVKQHLTSSSKPNVTRMAQIVMEVIGETQGDEGRDFKYLKHFTMLAIEELEKADVDYNKLLRYVERINSRQSKHPEINVNVIRAAQPH